MSYRELSPRDQAALSVALQGAAIFGRDDLLAIRASGKHHRRFLHALLTAPFDPVEAGRSFAVTSTDAQGRLHAVADVLTDADEVLLWTGRPQAQALVDRLLGHRVAERVQIAIDESLAAVDLIGPAAAEIARAAGLPIPEQAGTWVAADVGEHAAKVTTLQPPSAHPEPDAGFPQVAGGLRISLPRDAVPALVGPLLGAGAQVGCFAAGEAIRVLRGDPRLPVDVPEGSTPWEAGLGDGVSLEKGCYLGQEALAMQAWRGQLRRHLCWVVPEDGATPPPAGTLLRDEAGRRAGHTGSGVVLPEGALGLAMVSRKAAAPGTRLTAANADADTGTTVALRVIGTTRQGVLAT